MEAIESEPKRCSARRRDGTPCRSPVIFPGAYCFAHDPDRAVERSAARRKGGHNSAKIVRMRGLVPPRLRTVYDTLEQALGEVHTGQLEARQATAMAAVARAMVSVLTSGEMEERLRALEERSTE